MENETIQERDRRDAIKEIRKALDSATKAQSMGEISQADFLLLLGHIVDFLNSQYGALERTMKRQEEDHRLITNPHGENGVTLKDLYKRSTNNKKWIQAGLMVLLGLALTQIWNVSLRLASEKKTDRQFEELVRKLDAQKAQP